MSKNDGAAEVRKSQFGWQVIINHFEGEPEVWDKFCLLYTSPSPRDRG